jgi:hypothetical protein
MLPCGVDYLRDKRSTPCRGIAGSTSDIGRLTAIGWEVHLDHLRQRRNMRLRDLLLVVESHEADEVRVVVFADLQGEHVSHRQREDDVLVWI